MKATTVPVDTKTVRIDRVFDATIERLWELFTDPSEIAVWGCGDWYHHEDIDLDLRVGGVIHHRVTTIDDGTAWTFHGAYHEIDGPRRLVYSFDWKTDWREPFSPSMVSIDFATSEEGGAAIHLQHTGLSTDSFVTAEAHWNSFLDVLAGLI